MITVYCPKPQLQNGLRQVLGNLSAEFVAEDWGRFQHKAKGGRLAVVMFDGLNAVRVAQLQRFRQMVQHSPVVLITPRDADNLRLVTRVVIDEVIWTHEIPNELLPAIYRVTSRSVFRELSEAIKNAPDVPDVLRRALSLTCDADRPYRSVNELAKAAGCDRVTLWRGWREWAGPGTRFRLQDFCDWFLILRAAAITRRGVSWGAVSRRLNIHEDTLGRISHRLTGAKLSEISVDPQAWLETQVRIIKCEMFPPSHATNRRSAQQNAAIVDPASE